jgi:hypothetical protein
MDEEKSFHSSEETEEYEETEEDVDDNLEEFNSNNHLKPRKSTTIDINSSTFKERSSKLRVQTKLSTLYRQGTSTSELTIGGQSNKLGVLTSIQASKEGTDSEVSSMYPGYLK